MQKSRAAGKIIFIDGASSSGKTTISHALQEALDQPFLHFSIDHLRDAGVLPLERIRAGHFDWRALRPSFFDGFHSCLPALAATGNNLIVEHIVETEEWMRRLVRLLSPFDVFFVRLHCPLAELEKRERNRGDRRAGEAHEDFHRGHDFALYDLEIDSTESLEDNVKEVIVSWKNRAPPSAFDQMEGAARFQD